MIIGTLIDIRKQMDTKEVPIETQTINDKQLAFENMQLIVKSKKEGSILSDSYD